MHIRTKTSLLFLCCLGAAFLLPAQKDTPSIPAVHANLQYDKKGNLQGKAPDGSTVTLYRKPAWFTLSGVTPEVRGEQDGLRLQFAAERLRGGSVVYGLIPFGQHTYPTAVLRFEAGIDSTGAAFLPVRKDLKEGYDHTGWQKSGRGVLGFRLIDQGGNMVYEGKTAFAADDKQFVPLPVVLRGPFLSCQTDTSITIWYETSEPVETHIEIPGVTVYKSGIPVLRHEYTATGLRPDTHYEYAVQCGDLRQQYRFSTAPAPGPTLAFTFAYASDSRSGYGGGERNIYGANSQIMSRIGALALREDAAFVQFTGDLFDGYVSDPDEWRLQAANWIHAVEPYWHYIPFNVGMGNHESLGWASAERNWVAIDGFPYETHSAEAQFGALFVNPLNGPESEDGAVYDPNPDAPGDFPSYRENVFAYTHGNTAMVVLNSNYWFSPLLRGLRFIGGNLHGYVMDRQLEWLDQTLQAFEADTNILHVFVTIHTPPFPNGGHRGDCMWYNGDNGNRPYVAGKGLAKGIIERRDEILDRCVNRSSKVVAFLCGDEHNYNRMIIDDQTPRYPDPWFFERQPLKRPVWQIINGAAGAPFYAQQQAPWSAAVRGFTVQNALCLFDISGKEIVMRVVNPDTLEEIDRVQLR
ncbi:MAG: metallophosphoesterase family protein [Thermoanaerobaculia bacterium]|nr:metallophosphoesterase family protein [Thermoanaerobaculia bacterium]